MSTKKGFTKYINNLSKKELIIELDKLYSKFKNVQDYYSMELTEDTSAILNKYKEVLKKEYFPNSKFGIGEGRASVARKLISEFSKIKIFESDLIDLMLYRIELCVEYAKSIGDVNEQFYVSAENAFVAVVKLIGKNKLQSQFIDRCKQILNETENTGWSFNEVIENIYDEYFK